MVHCDVCESQTSLFCGPVCIRTTYHLFSLINCKFTFEDSHDCPIISSIHQLPEIPGHGMANMKHRRTGVRSNKPPEIQVAAWTARISLLLLLVWGMPYCVECELQRTQFNCLLLCLFSAECSRTTCPGLFPDTQKNAVCR